MPKQPTDDPTVPITIDGVVHHVPHSKVRLEQLIGEAAKKAKSLTKLETERDNSPKVQELQRLLDAQKAEVAKTEGRLNQAKAAYESPINTVQAELDAIEAQIAELMRPLMGGQKTMKYRGAAGVIDAVRSPKFKVVDKARLRRLLGQDLGTYFTVEEVFTANKAAAELPWLLKGKKLETFQQAVEFTDPIRARLAR